MRARLNATKVGVFALSFALCFLAPATAQTSAQTAQRDPGALAEISQAIQALGGAATIGTITNAVVTGAAVPVPGSSAPVTTFVWTDAWPEFRVEVQQGPTDKVFLSGHGQPAAINNGQVQLLPPPLALAKRPFHLPGVVLMSFLSDPRYTITMDGPGSVEGTAAVRVKVQLDTDDASALVTPQEWYFDPSGLPLRVDFQEPEVHQPNQQYDQAAFEFTNFQEAGGMLIPFSIAVFEGGQATVQMSIAAANFNQAVNPQQFDPPSGGVL